MGIHCSHGRSDSSHAAVLFFSNRQQSPDQAVQMTRLIWVFAVLMGRSLFVCLCRGFMAQSTQWGHVERGQFT